MTFLFISHSGDDRALAGKLVDALRADGFGAVFCDIDPVQGIAAGHQWEKELYGALRRCDGVIFLATASSVASRWCFAELALARSLGRPIFAARATTGANLSLIDDVQWVDLTDDESGYARLVTGLRRTGLDPSDSFDWDPRRSPYPGLRAFAPEDAAVFFGRNVEIDQLLQLVQPTLTHGSGRWVSIVGPSGSGKSSLLRAGLLPRLIRMRDRWAVVPVFVPGTRPTQQLGLSLARAFGEHGPDAAEVRRRLAGCTSSSAAGTELVDLLCDLSEMGDRSGVNVVLAIDQTEELITRTADHERRFFLEMLGGALRDASPLWIVSTLRSEYLSTAPDGVRLSAAAHDSLVVEPLGRNRLPEVILRPARRAGVAFEPGLAERMVDETTGGDALPLLAYTLQELVNRAGTDEVIRTQDYELIGGVVGSLQRRADRLVDELTARSLGPVIIPALLKLVTVDAAGEPVRRRISNQVLTSEEKVVIEAFVDARLLVSRSTADTPDAMSIEVAHEALLRQWPPLRQAIQDTVTSLRLNAELERGAAEWHDRGSDESYLMRGARLARFTEWASDGGAVLDDAQAKFLRASQELASRELNRAQHANRRLRRILIGAIILLIAAMTAGGLAIQQTRTVRRQTSLAISRQLTSTALSLRYSRPDVSLLLGVLAVAKAPAATRQDTQVDLLQGLNQPFHVSSQIIDGTDPLNSVAYSPNGALVAAGSDDGSVRVFDVASGHLVGKPMVGHTGWVHGVAFSPDGSLIASAGKDGIIRLWQTSTGHPQGASLTGNRQGVSDVAFSPDGTRLASAGEDGTVREWDLRTGAQIRLIRPDRDFAVWDVKFSPDGSLLASASADGTARLWNVATGHQVDQFDTPGRGWVNGVAFSHDGRLLASAGADGEVCLWDVAGGHQIGQAMDPGAGEASSVGFTRDDSTLVSGHRDGSLHLWSVAHRNEIGIPLLGHFNAIRSVDVSPDGVHIASAGYDATIRIWNLATTQPEGSPVSVPGGAVSAVAFDRDGSTLASAAGDGSIALWGVAGKQRTYQPLAHDSGHWITSLAFNPSGSLLASGDYAGAVRVWSVANGKLMNEFWSKPRAEVSSVAFTADGSAVVSGSRDGTVRVWDLATGRERLAPMRTGDDQVLAIAINAAGSLVASANEDGTVRLWDLRTGRPHGQPLMGHTGWVLDIAFSPDGSTLISSGGDGTVRVWNVASDSPAGGPLLGHADEVDRAIFAGNESTAVSAGKDGTIRVWDVKTGRVVGTPITTPVGTVEGLAFSLKNDLVAEAAADGTLRFFDLSRHNLISEACGVANRDLSRSEWEEFVGHGLGYTMPCAGVPR